MFSLVLPVHNERAALIRNIDVIRDELSKAVNEYEIIIAEDGSSDGTYSVARDIEKRYKNITVSHSDEKLGRGRALKKAFEISEGELVGYMDIDLATDISHLKEMIEKLDRYDVVTGSRFLRTGTANRTFKRYLFSRAFNLMIRALFRSRVMDHQCGFKGFRRDVVNEINKEVIDRHWFWDTEVLVVAQKRGFKVAEFPVFWKENTQSKVNIKRDVLAMMKGMVRLFYRLNL